MNNTKERRFVPSIENCVERKGKVKMIYAVVDNKGDLFGVCDDKYKAQKAIRILKEKDDSLFYDVIECPVNEIQFEDDIFTV